MCTDPQIQAHDGIEYEVACRSCNACLSTRKASWVARCMAEKHTMSRAMCATFTYRDDIDPSTGEASTPDGAVVFNYSHWRQFLDSLGKAYKRHYGLSSIRNELSWIVCGEFGSKNGRVHWHAILFSKRDLSVLSTWRRFGTNQKCEFKLDWRMDWDLWPHGLVHVIVPNKRGMNYVLKYAFKDQFNVVKARKTARFSKSERFSAGKFRQSKGTPIGDAFIVKTLWECLKGRYVLPTLELKVPNLKGFWFPTGRQRVMLAAGLFYANKKRFEETGKDAPEYNNLLTYLEKIEDLKAEEDLIYGYFKASETSEAEFEAEFERLQQHHNSKQVHRDKVVAARRTVASCGGVLPCEGCANASTNSQLDYWKGKKADWVQTYRERTAEQDISRLASGDKARGHSEVERQFDHWFKTKFRPSRLCALRNDKRLIEDFAACWAAYRLQSGKSLKGQKPFEV